MALLFVVEDDENIGEIERYALQSGGYEVSLFTSAEATLQALEKTVPDLILLDLMLPGLDGMSLLKQIRKTPRLEKVPIIIVSAKGRELDIVKGLDVGADDYIPKPFGVMELLSRVKASLRRIKTEEKGSLLQYEGIVLDEEKHLCFVHESPVELTFKEFELLKLFLSHVGIVLTRDVIMNTVWGLTYMGETRTVDMHINSLRKKLQSEGFRIQTVRNMGYKLL